MEYTAWKYWPINLKSTLIWLCSGLAVLCMLIGGYYWLHQPANKEAGSFFLLAVFFVFPLVFTFLQLPKIARLWLVFITPLFLIGLSVYGIHNNILVESVHYIAVRILLVSTAILPIILFPAKRIKVIVASLVFGFTVLILFDPLHSLFGASYYQRGFNSVSYWIAANAYAGLSYILISSSLLVQKIIAYRNFLKLKEKTATQKNYLNSLLKISALSSVSQGNIGMAYHEIGEIARSCLGVSRVSFWHYMKEEDALNCFLLLDKEGEHANSAVLSASQFPHYFSIIKRKGLIIATRARQDPCTMEFAQNYLVPNNIYSMMDGMFKVDGELAGIICCEHQHLVKDWNTEDSIFLRAVSDFICLVHSTNSRKEQARQLAEKNKLISNINATLEDTVNERTLELKRKNSQLAEYAFINSHLLRGPVARVAGLVNLIGCHSTLDIPDEYLAHLKKSVVELEEVTVHINEAIDTFGEVKREELEKHLSRRTKL